MRTHAHFQLARCHDITTKLRSGETQIMYKGKYMTNANQPHRTINGENLGSIQPAVTFKRRPKATPPIAPQIIAGIVSHDDFWLSAALGVGDRSTTYCDPVPSALATAMDRPIPIWKRPLWARRAPGLSTPDLAHYRADWRRLVEGFEGVADLEFGIREGVALLDDGGGGVVQDHVHAGEAGGGGVLLPARRG